MMEAPKDKNKGTKKPKTRPTEYYEEQMFSEIGMTRNKDYTIEDCSFQLADGTQGHLHTIECGDPSLQPLVLIHGYGSGAIFFFKLMAELKDRFHIYAVDLHGMGSSSRPKIKELDFNGVGEFLLEPLEVWRRMKGIENFVLAGFSMGGYIAALWMKIKRPPVACVYLLSPAGFTNKSDAEIKKKSGFTGKVFNLLYKTYIHKKKINPFGMVPFRNSVLKKSCDGKLTGFTKDEVKWATKYLISIFDKDESGERVLGVLLRYLKYSPKPICEFSQEMIEDAKSGKNVDTLPPIKVIFGDQDLMDYVHAWDENTRRGRPVDMDIMAGCDHQLIHKHRHLISYTLTRDLDKGYDNIRREFLQQRGIPSASPPLLSS